MKVISEQGIEAAAKGRTMWQKFSQLIKKSSYDSLTGVLSRGAIEERLDRLIAIARRYKKRPLSILMIDIDHFKEINDTYGHPVGDTVLRKMPKLIRQGLREPDIIGRFGGEEFVLTMQNTKKVTAKDIAEAIRTRVEITDFVFEGQKIPVTISIGCASRGSGALSWDGLFKKADQALYTSKNEGRNCVTVASE